MIDALLEQPLIALFAAIGLGMALGQVRVFGLSLGSSGVLFAALLLGHLGYNAPAGVGAVGLVLFVYCVGVGAGGRFFASLARKGSHLALLSLIVVTAGAAGAWGFAEILGLPADLSSGLFAGALTSTPALAAATDVLGEQASLVPIGYGIAYPFGVVGVVVFVQLLPRILRLDLAKEAEKLGAESSEEARIVTRTVEVTNPKLEGERIAENTFINAISCQVTRIVRDGRLIPLSFDDKFEMGMKLLLVGREDQISTAVDFVGREVEESYAADTQRERRQLIVKDRDISGKPLRDLNVLRDYNVVISRITRLGLTFVPKPDTVVEMNDVLTVVGSPEALSAFAAAIKHRSQAFDETDLLSVGVGITVGIVLGRLQIGLAGGESFSLGLAGGPLIVGLILGHFGRVGRIVGHIPRPTRILMQELGLVLFLADAGFVGGSAFVETVTTYGLMIFAMGALITVLPVLIALPIATKVLKMNILEALGGICGGMTSTPALGAITAKTDSQAPVVSYATAYPVSLILMTVFAKLLIQLVG